MQRFIAILALIGLFAVPAHSADKSTPDKAGEKSALTEAQKAEVKKLVRAYILENPGIISEAIEAQQVADDKVKAEKRTAVAKNRSQEIFNPSEATILGNPKGDVTVVEFFDYNCGYCKAMFPDMMDLVKQDSKVRLVLKEFPILGPSSLTASRAALASRKQNKYSEYHLAMLSHKGALTDDMVFDIAKNVGLDVKKLKEDMKDPEITTVITRNHDLAQALDIDGTPALFVGNTFVAGAIPKDQLMKLVASSRKPS